MKKTKKTRFKCPRCGDRNIRDFSGKKCCQICGWNEEQKRLDL